MKTAIARFPFGPRPARFAVLLFVLVLSACTSVTLISDYDEGIDRGITDLQKTTETFLLQMEHNGRPGSNDLTNEEQAFFDKTAVDLTALQIRAAAVPKNDITTFQLATLKDSFLTLERLLKAGVTKGQVLPIHDAFNTSTGAILRLELAKKRGAKTSS